MPSDPQHGNNPINADAHISSPQLHLSSSRAVDEDKNDFPSSPSQPAIPEVTVELLAHPQTYRLYKRRFLGLVVLVLLNVIVSWCWLVFASVASTSAAFFNVSESAVNWLTTGYLFAFTAASPIAMYTLNKGVNKAMMTAGGLLLVSSWLRYAGTRLGHRGFGLAVLSQILCGFAQPFVLAAPTRYSHLWFTERGRITATALASLANPLGGAVSLGS